jgi:phosphoglycerol transferase MdoB-like AlkP superfamily enzyme
MVSRVRGALSPSRHPDLWFWASFLVLNLLLFLPYYLLNWEEGTFWPSGWPADAPVGGIVAQLLGWRNNPDIFRLSVELALLAVVWVFLGRLARPRLAAAWRAVFAGLYLAMLSYYIYEAISLSLYQMDPVFYSQAQLAAEGIGFVAESLQLSPLFYAGVAAAVIALVALILWLCHRLAAAAATGRLRRATRLGVVLLAIWAVVAAVRYEDTLSSPKMAASSFATKLQQNVADSLVARQEIRELEAMTPQFVYNLRGQTLLHKPDIYLIFVESYGSVLYKSPKFQKGYAALLPELEEQLAGDGWHMGTALSEAPTWGGGSWMSYTSTLFGMRIDTHPKYLALMDRYQDERYPDLGAYLRSQGYYYLGLAPIATELKSLNWTKYTNFYGVDRWLRYKDFSYQGPLYGWGPAPPDQYVLEYAREVARSTVYQPLFLFYLTQNSHYPWTPLPEMAEDWRALNEPGAEVAGPLSEAALQQMKYTNYLKAIDYELRMLADFIQEGDGDAIYVLIGDHQPQQVSRRSHGFETPIHIITRDQELAAAFEPYGFVPGLQVEDVTPVLRHEGFYSMFTRVLLSRYGDGMKMPPRYLPDGLVAGDGAGAGYGVDGG